MATMVAENPKLILITEEMTDYCALLAHSLFNKKGEE